MTTGQTLLGARMQRGLNQDSSFGEAVAGQNTLAETRCHSVSSPRRPLHLWQLALWSAMRAGKSIGRMQVVASTLMTMHYRIHVMSSAPLGLMRLSITSLCLPAPGLQQETPGGLFAATADVTKRKQWCKARAPH